MLSFQWLSILALLVAVGVYGLRPETAMEYVPKAVPASALVAAVSWMLRYFLMVPTCLGWITQSFLLLPWIITVPVNIIIWLVDFIPKAIMEVAIGKAGHLQELPRKLAKREWFIHGKAYDLSAWAKQHPGGERTIRCGQNRDCTALFESYHVFIDHAVLMKMLARFEIKDVTVPDNPQEATVEDLQIGDARQNLTGLRFCDPFHEDVKQMLRDHFKGKSHKMKEWMACVVGMLSVLELVIVYYFLSGEFWAVIALPFIAFIHVNTAHDGSHFAVSKHEWINLIASNLATPFFFTNTAWYLQHVVQHHAYTNDEDDVDLHHFPPVARVSLFTKWQDNFKFQWFTAYLGFPLVSFHFQFVIPMELLFGRIDCFSGAKRFSQAQNVEDYVARNRGQMVMELMMIWVWVFLAVACLGFKQGAYHLALSWSICSVIITLFTQGAHLQEECHLGTVETYDSWAKRQCATAVNVLPGSLPCSMISGALNMQSIHHVAPGIGSSHYIDLYPKFKDLCLKHDVQLVEVPLVDFIGGMCKWISLLSNTELEHLSRPSMSAKIMAMNPDNETVSGTKKNAAGLSVENSAANPVSE